MLDKPDGADEPVAPRALSTEEAAALDGDGFALMDEDPDPPPGRPSASAASQNASQQCASQLFGDLADDRVRRRALRATQADSQADVDATQASLSDDNYRGASRSTRSSSSAAARRRRGAPPGAGAPEDAAALEARLARRTVSFAEPAAGRAPRGQGRALPRVPQARDAEHHNLARGRLPALLQLALRDGAVASALAQVVGARYARRTAARRRQRLAAALAGLLAGPGDGAPLAPELARALHRAAATCLATAESPDDALAARFGGAVAAAAAAAGAYETGAALLERARLVACGGSCVRGAFGACDAGARRLLRLYAARRRRAARRSRGPSRAPRARRPSPRAPRRLRRRLQTLRRARAGRGAGRRGRRRRGRARALALGEWDAVPDAGPGAPPEALRAAARAAAAARSRRRSSRRAARRALAPRRRRPSPRRSRARATGAAAPRRWTRATRASATTSRLSTPAPSARAASSSRSSRRSAPSTPRRGPAAAASRTAGPQCPGGRPLRGRGPRLGPALPPDLPRRAAVPAQTAPLDGQRLAAGALALSRGAVEVAQALCLKDKMFADNARGDIAAFKADFFLAAARRHADAGDGGGRERCCELYKKALEHAAERGPVHREFADALDAGAARPRCGDARAAARAQMDAAAQCLRADAESNDGAAAFAYADFLDEMLRRDEARAPRTAPTAKAPLKRPRHSAAGAAACDLAALAPGGGREPRGAVAAAAVASYLRAVARPAATLGARVPRLLAVRVAARPRPSTRSKRARRPSPRRRSRPGAPSSSPCSRRAATATATSRALCAGVQPAVARLAREAPASVRDALRFAAERLPEGHPVLKEALAACFDDAAEAFAAAARPARARVSLLRLCQGRAPARGARRRRGRRADLAPLPPHALDASWDGVGARVGETNATFGQKLRKSPKVHAVDAAILKGRDVARACKDAKAEALARKNEMKGGPPRPDLAAYSRYLADFDGRDDVAVPGRPALRIARFRDQLLALASKQRPKRLTIVATDGAAYDYLVKGGEDLRLDDRVEQLFDAMGAALSRAGGAARRRGLAVRTFRSRRDGGVCGYVVGLGDRHLDNLLLADGDGAVVHIDMGYAFGTATTALPVPELIPFRLTRELRAPLAPLDGDALFADAAETALAALRGPRDAAALLALLETFVREPVLDWLDGRTTTRRASRRRAAAPTAAASPPTAVPGRAAPGRAGAGPAAATPEQRVAPMKEHAKAVARGDPGDARRDVDGDVDVRDQVRVLVDLATDPNCLGRHWKGLNLWC
ncbi:hypothetical protein JL720_9643 [Aureococcus anophagefferens]|nr:hypothetical protein JL720_9643 [Aureococcus anophagefferens]